MARLVFTVGSCLRGTLYFHSFSPRGLRFVVERVDVPFLYGCVFHPRWTFGVGRATIGGSGDLGVTTNLGVGGCAGAVLERSMWASGYAIDPDPPN